MVTPERWESEVSASRQFRKAEVFYKDLCKTQLHSWTEKNKDFQWLRTEINFNIK